MAREVVIWGTGQLAMKLVSCTPLARRRIVACVDTNPIHPGKTLDGAPIRPEDSAYGPSLGNRRAS